MKAFEQKFRDKNIRTAERKYETPEDVLQRRRKKIFPEEGLRNPYEILKNETHEKARFK